MEIRVLILGSNNISNYEEYSYFEEQLYSVLEKYFEEEWEIVVREQEVNLIDNFSVRFAKENNCILERCGIDWNKYGKKAAYENIKKIIWGEDGQAAVDKIIVFQKKSDKYKDLFMIDKILDEFKGMIILDSSSFSNIDNIYIFEK